MGSDPYTHFIAIGACYIDTILTVPAYPQEDAKQRASTLTKRRGGNCPNSLEVLQQLLQHCPENLTSRNFNGAPHGSNDTKAFPQLFLVSTLPAEDSADTKFIADSFNAPPSDLPSSSSGNNEKNHGQKRQPVNLDHALHRSLVSEAASSYIIKSVSTSTRTIVNYNALDEMTVTEFQQAVRSILVPITHVEHPKYTYKAWIHFEGRIPDITAECISWLQTVFSSQHGVRTTISVEIEKPAREGLERLAELADVVLYSRSWAEARGYTSARECLIGERRRIAATVARGSTEDRRSSGTNKDLDMDVQRTIVSCCTWGESGAAVLESTLFQDNDNDDKITVKSAYRPSSGEPLKVMDTIGAGDTWIAGMLFSLMMMPSVTTTKTTKIRGYVEDEPQSWDMCGKVEFANELAGRKISREGFSGLGRDMIDAGWFD